MATKTRRPQTRKNTEYMRAMQEIRRSNAAQPIPSASKYKRNVKHRTRQFDY